MNIDIDDTNMNISLQELKQLLLEKKKKINELTFDSKSNAATLKKINQAIDEQHNELINIIIKLGDSLVDIDNLDRYAADDEDDFSSKLENVEVKLRKIKGSLANLIKNG
jgi:DNA-directed RNA polymerase subunit F|tara:strand:+ start:2523 stop:2852 length:330 start_codon:yes stop_codon:yes gene_type:complete